MKERIFAFGLAIALLFNTVDFSTVAAAAALEEQQIEDRTEEQKQEPAGDSLEEAQLQEGSSEEQKIEDPESNANILSVSENDITDPAVNIKDSMDEKEDGTDIVLYSESSDSIDIRDIDSSGSDLFYIDGSNFNEWDGKTLTGLSDSTSVIVNGVTLHLTIRDLSIDRHSLESDWISAIGVTGGGTLYLTLEGNSTLQGSKGGAGIWVDSGSTLEITRDSTGSVTAIGGNGYGGAAGIGAYSSGYKFASGIQGTNPSTRYTGVIRIAGGTVTAKGGTHTVFGTTTPWGGAAGIGGSFGAGGAEIQIMGGTVMATGGYWAAGIGGGYCGSAGKIEITGGTVTASNGSDSAAAIGNGFYNMTGTALPFGDITISGGDVTVNGNIGYGNNRTEVYPEDTGSVTIAEGAYPKITGKINRGNSTDAGSVRYDVTFSVYDGRFTADTEAKVSLEDKIIGDAIEARVTTPGKAEISLSFNANAQLSGEKTFTIVINRRSYTAAASFSAGTNSYALTAGTVLYPVTLQFYDDTLMQDIKVKDILIGQGDKILSMENGEYYAPDQITKVCDTYGEMICYLPAGDNMTVSVTAGGLNDGSSMEQTGCAVSTSGENIIVLKNRTGLSINVTMESVTVSSAKVTVALNRDGGETAVYYRKSTTALSGLSAEDIKNNQDGDASISSGTSAGTVEIDGLNPDQEYFLYFAAGQGDVLSQVVGVTFRTEKVAFVEEIKKISDTQLYVDTNTRDADIYCAASNTELHTAEEIVSASDCKTGIANQKSAGKDNVWGGSIYLSVLPPATEYTYYFVLEKDGSYSDVKSFTFVTKANVAWIRAGETEEIPCTSIEEAFARAKENPGSTVRILEDYNVSADWKLEVSEGEDITLDLNGKKLNVGSNISNQIKINGGKLSIINGRLYSDKGIDYSVYNIHRYSIFDILGGELSMSGVTFGSNNGAPYFSINGENAVVSLQNVKLTNNAMITVEKAKSFSFNNVTLKGALRVNNTPSVTLTDSTFDKDVLLDNGILADDTFNKALKLGIFSIDPYIVKITETIRSEGSDLGTLLQTGYLYQNLSGGTDDRTAKGTGKYSLSAVEVSPVPALSGTLTITGASGENDTPVWGDTLTASFSADSGSSTSTDTYNYTWYRIKDNARTKLSAGVTYQVTAEDIGSQLCCVVVNSAQTGKKEAETTAVAPKTLTDQNIVVTLGDTSSYIYDGKAKEPVVTSVTNGATTLTVGTDYTVTYKKNVNAGTAEAVITAMGSYQGAVTKTFVIQPKEVRVYGITALNKQYDGTTAATLIYSNVVINGRLDADSLAVRAEGTFADEKSGDSKQVNITKIELTGASAVNYKLASDGQQTTTTANIIPLRASLSEAPVISGTYGTAVKDMTITGGKVVDETDTAKEISGIWRVSDTAGNEMPKVGTTKGYKLTFTPEGQYDGVYQNITCQVIPSVTKKPITIRINDAVRKYKESDPVFCCENWEDRLVAGDTASAISVRLETNAKEDSPVGSYAVTGSAESDNYEVTFIGSNSGQGELKIEPASAPVIPAENRSYTYNKGSKGDTVSIDLASKLPADRGRTSYENLTTTDDAGILDGNVSVDQNGVLSYKVKNTLEADMIGKQAVVSVDIDMGNYERAKYQLTITMVGKRTVTESVKAAVAGNETLTYGQKLGELKLNCDGTGAAVFIDTDTSEPVKGSLKWKQPENVPVAGTTTAEWCFTPEDDSYEPLAGTTAIIVNKAEPNQVISPIVATTDYHPARPLINSNLSGGSVKHMVGDTETDVDGTWVWQTDRVIPTVDNIGYTAVFLPTDTANYKSVTRTVSVTVRKAVPVISQIPDAEDITYGSALDSSALYNGAVQYSLTDTTVVKGHFEWKDGSIKPSVSDSQITKYKAVFVPDDRVNYESIETEVMVTVRKQQITPNKPSDIMNVPYRAKKISDIVLPDGWEWESADRDQQLAVNTTVRATAVYTGADKGNYETEKVVITVTRSQCEHKNTEVRNAAEANYEQTGYTGDIYCKDCDVLVSKGTATAALSHSSSNTAASDDKSKSEPETEPGTEPGTEPASGKASSQERSGKTSERWTDTKVTEAESEETAETEAQETKEDTDENTKDKTPDEAIEASVEEEPEIVSKEQSHSLPWILLPGGVAAIAGAGIFLGVKRKK